MPSHRFHAPIATALTACGLMALAASPASAATRVLPSDINDLPRGGALEYGVVTWGLSSGAASKLKAAGSKLTATGTGKVKGSKITFDAATSGSVFDPTTMAGTIVLDGGITVKGRKTAKLTKVTLEPGLDKRVTAKLGGKLIELGSLKGGKVTFSRQADGELAGAKLALSAAGAKKLNAATGGGFAKGTFATVGVEATSRELPLKSGTATMTLDPALLKMLSDGGYTITAKAPATSTGNVVTIPLTAGAFDPTELSGRLSLDGEVTIGNGPIGVTLFGWRTAVGPGQNELFANINSGVSAPIAVIDVSTLSSRLEGKRFISTGAKLTLSKIAVDVLKQQFKITMPVGTPLGTVDIDGLLSGQ